MNSHGFAFSLQDLCGFCFPLPWIKRLAFVGKATAVLLHSHGICSLNIEETNKEVRTSMHIGPFFFRVNTVPNISSFHFSSVYAWSKNVELQLWVCFLKKSLYF